MSKKLSRWVVLKETSPSGKRLFQCLVCERVSPTPDKKCPDVRCADVEKRFQSLPRPDVPAEVFVVFQRERGRGGGFLLEAYAIRDDAMARLGALGIKGAPERVPVHGVPTPQPSESVAEVVRDMRLEAGAVHPDNKLAYISIVQLFDWVDRLEQAQRGGKCKGDSCFHRDCEHYNAMLARAQKAEARVKSLEKGKRKRVREQANLHAEVQQLRKELDARRDSRKAIDCAEQEKNEALAERDTALADIDTLQRAIDAIKLDHLALDEAKARVKELEGIAVEVARIAYETGHNDTVESRYADPHEVAEDLCGDLIAERTQGSGECDICGDECNRPGLQIKLEKTERRAESAEARVKELKGERDAWRDESQMICAKHDAETTRADKAEIYLDTARAEVQRLRKELDQRRDSRKVINCAEQERDLAQAEVQRLRGEIQALVDRLTDWQCAKDEAREGVWPQLLVMDPAQWCLNEIRTLLATTRSTPETKISPKAKQDSLPECPKCDGLWSPSRFGVDKYGKPNEGKGTCRCLDGEYLTADEWLRHVAENTPCRECGELPAVYRAGMDGIGSDDTLDCETCNEGPWTKRTPREWYDRNKQEEDGDGQAKRSDRDRRAKKTTPGTKPPQAPAEEVGYQAESLAPSVLEKARGALEDIEQNCKVTPYRVFRFFLAMLDWAEDVDGALRDDGAWLAEMDRGFNERIGALEQRLDAEEYSIDTISDDWWQLVQRVSALEADRLRAHKRQERASRQSRRWERLARLCKTRGEYLARILGVTNEDPDG